jgi:Mg/Co/Ni transporter MgtE
MNILDYIQTDLESFHPDDSIRVAKKLFQKQPFSHIAVLVEKKLLGVVSKNDLVALDQNSKKISDLMYMLSSFHANDTDSFLELLHLFATNETDTLPVLNKSKEFLGYLDLSEVLSLFSTTDFLSQEGVFLSLEKESSAYSMTEIAQIAETNEGKLLGVFVSKTKENTTEITVKIDTKNADEIIQSFRRYDYTVRSSLRNDSYLEDLENRSNYLQKYLTL